MKNLIAAFMIFAALCAHANGGKRDGCLRSDSGETPYMLDVEGECLGRTSMHDAAKENVPSHIVLDAITRLRSLNTQNLLSIRVRNDDGRSLLDLLPDGTQNSNWLLWAELQLYLAIITHDAEEISELAFMVLDRPGLRSLLSNAWQYAVEHGLRQEAIVLSFHADLAARGSDGNRLIFERRFVVGGYVHPLSFFELMFGQPNNLYFLMFEAYFDENIPDLTNIRGIPWREFAEQIAHFPNDVGPLGYALRNGNARIIHFISGRIFYVHPQGDVPPMRRRLSAPSVMITPRAIRDAESGRPMEAATNRAQYSATTSGRSP